MSASFCVCGVLCVCVFAGLCSLAWDHGASHGTRAFLLEEKSVLVGALGVLDVVVWDYCCSVGLM